MSLLSNVLESFGGGAESYGSYSGPALDPAVTNGALLETMNTIIEVERVSNSADVVGAMKVVIEGTDVTDVMEGFFKDAFNRLVGAFVKLKNTIKKWFDDAVKFFMSMFKNGNDFVKSYGDELRSKETTGFEYLGYEWDEKKGNALVDKIYRKVDALIDEAIGDLSKAAEMTADELSDRVTKNGESKDVDDIVISCGIGANNVSQMKDEIKKAYRSGMEDPASDASITSSQVSNYLTFIGTGKDTISTVKKDQAAFESRLNRVINTLNGIAKNKDDGGDKAKNATACSKLLTTIFSVKKSAADAKVDNLRTMLKSETSVLRKFLHWRGDKAVQNSVDYDLAEMELLEATYPEFMSDDIMEEGFDMDYMDDGYDYTAESYYDDNTSDDGSLYSQIANMIGI